MGTGGVVHTSRGSRLLSEYNCCFHFHEKLFALELSRRGNRKPDAALGPDWEHCKYCPSGVLSHRKLQTAVSPQLKRDVWGLELQPRVFTKRLIVSPGSRLLLNGGSSYPRYFVLLRTLRVPREADPHTLQQRGHFAAFWLAYGLNAGLLLAERDHRMRRWVNIWEELRMCGSVWRQFEGVFVFLWLQIWKCDGGIRLVTVRILTWGDPIVQKTDTSGMLMHFWAAQIVMISPKIHQHLPATHNDSGLKWSDGHIELEPEHLNTGDGEGGLPLLVILDPWLPIKLAKNSEECAWAGTRCLHYCPCIKWSAQGGALC